MTTLLMDKNKKIKASTGEKRPVTVGSVLVYIGLLFWAFVSVFPDAAGVDDHHVRVEPVLRLLASFCLQQSRDGLRIMLVHLTSEGDDMIFFSCQFLHQ